MLRLSTLGAEVGSRPDALHVVALHVVGDRRRAAVAAGEHAGTCVGKPRVRIAAARSSPAGSMDFAARDNLLGIGVEVRCRARVRSDRELDRAAVGGRREGPKIVGRTHTATRSKMNGAAAARLGNDQTPGRW